MYHKPKKPDIFTVSGITQKLREEKNVEHLYIIKYGRAIAWFEGSKESVNPPEEQMIRFKDSLVLHNHPNGTSFSFDDISNAIEFNIKEMRLITAQNTFILKRPTGGWNINFREKTCIEIFNTIVNSIEKKFDLLYSSGQITGKELEEHINHFIWVDFFSRFDVSYKKY